MSDRPVFPRDGALVTPNDTVRFPESAIWVGTAGDISVITAAGTTLTIPAFPAGGMLPFMCIAVRSTGTTASNIVRAA